MFVRNEGELIQVMQPIQKPTQINVGQHVTCIKAERERVGAKIRVKGFDWGISSNRGLACD